MNNIDNLITKITYHLNNLDLVEIASEKLLQACANGDIERIEFLTVNRGRLVNLIQEQQNHIEQMIDQNSQEFAIPETVDLLKAWINDIAIKTEKITYLDQEILEELSKEKTKTTQEIAATFKTKESFKGYNLNKVR